MSRALDVEKVEQLATQRLLLAPLSFSLSLLIPSLSLLLFYISFAVCICCCCQLTRL